MKADVITLDASSVGSIELSDDVFALEPRTDILQRMNIEDVRNFTLDQLEDELIKLKREQFNLRFQKATSQLTNTARVREVRRTIARIKTVEREKRVAEAQS